MMTEPEWKIQLSLKAGDDMLNVRGEDTREIAGRLAALGINPVTALESFQKEYGRPEITETHNDGTPRRVLAPAAVKHASNRGYKDAVPTADPTVEKKCPACGANVHDNLNDPTRGNKPVYKCKNYKECTGYTNTKTGEKGPWVTWDEDFFTPTLPAMPADDPSQYDWSAPR